MQNLVTVFGGSGFVGGQVVRALAKTWRIRVAIRQPNLAYAMRLSGDVGQIDIVQANIRDEASVRRALDGASACVNLVGVLYETSRQTFRNLHVEGARTVARAAKAEGIAGFVQMSAMGADPQARSDYARSKAEGEAAVRDALPGAAVLRPSVIFGPGDDFFNRFAAMATMSPALPLIGGGHTRFQPVYVGDVAQAVARALGDLAGAGQTYELGGPAVLTFRELMQIVVEETGRRRLLAPIPFPVAGLMARGGDLLAALGIKPPLTSDQVASLRTDNVASGGLPGLAELGIVPTPVEAVLSSYLYRYRKGGQYADQPERIALV
jgi:NADH dehydrogenase